MLKSISNKKSNLLTDKERKYLLYSGLMDYRLSIELNSSKSIENIISQTEKVNLRCNLKASKEMISDVSNQYLKSIMSYISKNVDTL